MHRESLEVDGIFGGDLFFKDKFFYRGREVKKSNREIFTFHLTTTTRIWQTNTNYGRTF